MVVAAAAANLILVETGEEEEDTLFSCRAKLFQNVDKEWKERGLGTVKLNIHYPVLSPTTPPPTSHHEDVVQSASDDGDPEKQDLAQSPEPPQQPQQKARLVMRTDGVHRVVLNTPIFKGMKFGTVDGSEPTGKMMNLTGIEDGKPALFLLKVRQPFSSLLVSLSHSKFAQKLHTSLKCFRQPPNVLFSKRHSVLLASLLA